MPPGVSTDRAGRGTIPRYVQINCVISSPHVCYQSVCAWAKPRFTYVCGMLIDRPSSGHHSARRTALYGGQPTKTSNVCTSRSSIATRKSAK
jgi:hypothetical protein